MRVQLGLNFILKGSSDAHFPQVGMIIEGLNEKSINIFWLIFINGSVKNNPFTLSKSALFSASCFLVHVALNNKELC